MKVEIFIALHSEMSIKTLLKKLLINYTKSDIKKMLVLLPVDWDKNGLPFTKRFYMMNKTIGYS